MSAFLDRHERILLCSFVCFFFVIAAIHCSSLTLWFDELLTYSVARLPSLAEVWNAPGRSGDFQPPPGYFLFRFSMDLFGDSQIGIRLPSMICYCLTLLVVYFYVSRRLGRAYGWLALSFAAVRFEYAIEARPYAAMLLSASLVLHFWSEAAAGRKRSLNLTGLALALGFGMAMHVQSLLVLGPLALGELSRLIRSRRIDAGVALALLAGISPLLFSLPMLSYTAPYTASYWSRFEWHGLIDNSAVDALRFVSEPYEAAVFFVVMPLLFSSLRQSRRTGGRLAHAVTAFSEHEKMALLGFVLIPLAGAVQGYFTGIYTLRHYMAALIGLSIVLSIVVASISRLSSAWGAWGALVFFLSFLLVHVRPLLEKPELRFDRMLLDRPILREKILFLSRHSTAGIPIAASSPLDLLPLVHYAPAGLKQRLWFLKDTYSILRPGKYSFTVRRNLSALAQFVPLPVSTLGEFLEKHRRFYLLIRYGDRFRRQAGGPRIVRKRVPRQAWGEKLLLLDFGPVAVAKTLGKINADGITTPPADQASDRR